MIFHFAITFDASDAAAKLYLQQPRCLGAARKKYGFHLALVLRAAGSRPPRRSRALWAFPFFPIHNPQPVSVSEPERMVSHEARAGIHAPRRESCTDLHRTCYIAHRSSQPTHSLPSPSSSNSFFVPASRPHHGQPPPSRPVSGAPNIGHCELTQIVPALSLILPRLRLGTLAVSMTYIPTSCENAGNTLVAQRFATARARTGSLRQRAISGRRITLVTCWTDSARQLSITTVRQNQTGGGPEWCTRSPGVGVSPL